MAAHAQAQQRPLVTEDPETIGAGRVLLEGGFELRWDQVYTASGLEGDLRRLPVAGVSFGVGSVAEVQIDGGYSHLSITDRTSAPLDHLLEIEDDSTSAFEDLIIGTKIRLLSELPSRPALGVRFATKIPNASNESGLGLGTTDFFASLLVGKTVNSLRIVGNFGLGVLSNPLVATEHNNAVSYGFSVARAGTNIAEIVGEVNGHINGGDDVPAGTETRSLMRAGMRFTFGAGRLDAAALIGLTAEDPGFGITAGYTYVFNAFTVP